MVKFPVYFIAKKLAAANISRDKNIVWVLDVAPSDINDIYQSLNQQPVAVNFCLLLSVELVRNEKYLDGILAFLFYPTYKKSGSVPEVFWKPASPDLIEQAKEELEAALMEQGFDSPQHYLLSPDLGVTNVNALNLDQITSVYYEALKQNTHPCCFDLRDNADVLPFLNALVKAEIQFEKEQPVIFQLRNQNQQMKDELDVAESSLKAVKQELATCQLHMDILRSGTEARQLQDFYTNEYEILPLWYKKIGHVIKALTGKRSLRSLFSDKAKKYKT